MYVPTKGPKIPLSIFDNLKDNIIDLIECYMLQFHVKYDPSETLLAGDFDVKTRTESDFINIQARQKVCYIFV